MFSWLKPKPKTLGRATVSEQRRRGFRAPLGLPVTYALDGDAGTRRGAIDDLSVGGLRLAADAEVSPGTRLEIRFLPPNELLQSVHLEKDVVETTPRAIRTRKVVVPPDPFDEFVLHGTVVDAAFDPKRLLHVHGVRFERVTKREAEELERFVHLWQVYQLRARASQRGS